MKDCKYCKNIEEIENYAAAAADNFVGWDMHHRLETHNSDGLLRLVPLSREELKALGMYYDRPASELIFLKHRDHTRLHLLGQQRTPETRAKIGAASRDRHPSEETRAKISASVKLHLSKTSTNYNEAYNDELQKEYTKSTESSRR